MPVRWSSTHTMIDKFYAMKDAIIAVLATQSFDKVVCSTYIIVHVCMYIAQGIAGSFVIGINEESIMSALSNISEAQVLVTVPQAQDSPFLLTLSMS